MAVMDGKVLGGFFFGLPELFFDVFLLWDVMEWYASERRDATAGIPSWSCFGWKGGRRTSLDLVWWRFSMDHTLLDDAHDGYGSDCVVESIVTWYRKSDTLGLIPIGNHYHSCRSASAEELPSGWTKHDDEAGSTYWKHEPVNDMKFRYPILLSATDKENEPDDFS